TRLGAAIRRSGTSRSTAVVTAMSLLTEAAEQPGLRVHRTTTQNQGGNPARPLHSTRLLKRVQTREVTRQRDGPSRRGVARRTTRGLSAILFRPIGPENRACIRRNRSDGITPRRTYRLFRP